MKQKKSIKFISQLITLSLLGTQVVQAAGAIPQIVVNTTNDQSTASLTTLREAVDAANLLSGAEIIFDETVFSNPQTITLEQGEILITSEMTITGPGADLVTIDADNLSRIFTLNDSNSQVGRRVNIFGITLTNGNGESLVSNNGQGGCLFSAERLRLSASVIKNCNSSSEGGGAKTTRGENIIENSTFLNNTAVTGGGLAHQAGSSNIIIGSTFSGNTATRRGGGINVIQTGSIDFINNTVSNNQAGTGAGINANSAININNSTIINNVGQGINLRQDNIQNSVIAGNTDIDCFFDNIGFNNQNNLDTDGSCGIGAVNHITVADPLLGSLANNGGLTMTHLPLIGSPVIDMGDDSLCTEFDQRAVLRPQDGDADGSAICDIGAVELLIDLIFKDGFEAES